MTPEHPLLPDRPRAYPIAPPWVRRPAPEQTLVTAIFVAGAALSWLDTVARDAHPIGDLWRKRLALSAAANVAGLAGRQETISDLRDMWLLRTEADDPGPAGRILAAWRAVCRRQGLNDLGSEKTRGALLQLTTADEVDAAIQAAIEAGQSTANPVESAAAVLHRVLSVGRVTVSPALWLADVALADRLGWELPVPLIAGHLDRRQIRTLLDIDRDSRMMLVASSVRRGAVAAGELHATLARKAVRILEVAPKLRSKGADNLVLRLLTEDAMTARSGAPMTERSTRRLFERLVDLGAVQEMTGRSSFRIYGL